MHISERERIAMLRKHIAANKGKAERARKRRTHLLWVAESCEAQVRRDQAEIRALGGKVRD